MKSFFKGVVGAILVLILAALIIPQYSDYTDRAKVWESLKSIDALKIDIERQVIAGSLVEINIEKRNLSPHISFIDVDERGMIQLRVGDNGSFILVSPKLESSKNVVWVCRGGPSLALPPNCRDF